MWFLYLLLIITVPAAIYGIAENAKSKKNERKANENKNAYRSVMDQYWNTYNNYVRQYNEERANLLGDFKSCVPHNEIMDNEIMDNAYIARKNDGSILIYRDTSPTKPYYNNKGYPQMPTKGFIIIEHSFPLSDILYWAEKGSLQFTSNISGGGSDVAGALIGGAIAGDVGAIIGSREAVKTETVEHDTRKIIVKKTDATEIEFPITYQKAFITCMPEKEYEFLKMSNKLN